MVTLRLGASRCTAVPTDTVTLPRFATSLTPPFGGPHVLHCLDTLAQFLLAFVANTYRRVP